jgi:myosin protein heavy chain
LATLKKSLEEDTQSHEITITEMRHKHSQEISVINEQIESLKKVKLN